MLIVRNKNYLSLKNKKIKKKFVWNNGHIDSSSK